MITAHLRCLLSCGVNLMRMRRFVLTWRKPAATESMAQDERDNLLRPYPHSEKPKTFMPCPG